MSNIGHPSTQAAAGSDREVGVARSSQTEGSLRIVHVTNYQVPGYGYEEIQLSREQHRMGHDVTIIASNLLHPPGIYSVLRRRFPTRRVDPRSESVDGVTIKRLASREFARRAWIHGFERCMSDIQPDVVHVHNLLQFHLPRLAFMRARKRLTAAIVVDDHMHETFVRRSLLGRAFYATYRAAVQPVLGQYVDRYTAIAEDTREYLRHRCGVRSPIDVVPLGVATTVFMRDGAARGRVRAALGIGATHLLLLYTGKVIPQKGLDVLVDAAAALITDGTLSVVVAIGDADEAYARQLGETARRTRVPLHLVPSMENDRLPEWYSAADIAVWPRQESMAVFEAMASELPVVVSSRSGLAPIVAPLYGVTFDEDRPGALAESLRHLTSVNERRRLGEAARKLAESSLSWTRSAELYVSIYREAIAARLSR
jgi:glycosyltransferase involved in cell wall biosynthesis